MKSLEELRAIREKMQGKVGLREETVQEQNLSEKICVTQTGCIGLCQYEPIVEVLEPGKEKVTYVKMTPEKALEVLRLHLIGGVLRLHLIGGQVVTKYTLSAAQNSL